MYKVHTITLPDHYTLMDVAYIYTWKKVGGSPPVGTNLEEPPKNIPPTHY